MDLWDRNLVAIDDSRLKVFSSKVKNYTRGKLRQKFGKIDKAMRMNAAAEILETTLVLRFPRRGLNRLRGSWPIYATKLIVTNLLNSAWKRRAKHRPH